MAEQSSSTPVIQNAAVRNGASLRLLSMVMNLFELVQRALTLVGYAALLLGFSRLAVLGMLLAAVPATLAEMRFATNVFRLRNARAAQRLAAHELLVLQSRQGVEGTCNEQQHCSGDQAGRVPDSRSQGLQRLAQRGLQQHRVERAFERAVGAGQREGRVGARAAGDPVVEGAAVRGERGRHQAREAAHPG